MRRQLEFKEKKVVIISNKRLDKDEFITDSLFHFSKKNEYEIHLLEEISEVLKDNNRLLRISIGEPPIEKKSFVQKLSNKTRDFIDNGKFDNSNKKKQN